MQVKEMEARSLKDEGNECCKSLCIEKTKTEGLELQENESGRFLIKQGQQKECT